MSKHDLRDPTEQERELIAEACEECLEMGAECHSSDKHVVERMIKYGYRKPVTPK